MNEHHNPTTLSERADELEEQMMNELNDRIATKSVLFKMADGIIDLDNGPALPNLCKGEYMLDRRAFLAVCSRFGVAATLLPGVLVAARHSVMSTRLCGVKCSTADI